MASDAPQSAEQVQQRIAEKRNQLTEEAARRLAGIRRDFQGTAEDKGFLLAQLDEARRKYDEVYDRFELSDEARWYLKTQLDEFQKGEIYKVAADLSIELGKAQARNAQLVALVQEALSHCSQATVGYQKYGDLMARAAQELKGSA